MNRILHSLGLERNILVMFAGVLLVGIGEELWARFIPKYIEYLGAGIWVVALYGTQKDLLDAVYQYPGGWLADHLGRRLSLLLFIVLAIGGYALYLIAPSWQWLIVGTFLTAAWGSLTQPALFSIVGDNLPPARRSVGFGLFSILKRIPVVIAPVIGGWMVLTLGLPTGMRIGFAASILLAAVSFLIIRRYESGATQSAPPGTSILTVWRSMDGRLKRLLVADCLARWAEGIPNVFIVLYVVDILRFNPLEFGSFASAEMLTAIAVYIPLARMADRMNRKPFVVATFAFFALFPLALVFSTTKLLVFVAFIIAGLRELGEPARKALIVDLIEETMRGRTIGLYYLIRGLIVFPASIAGGLLWTISPNLPFYAAFFIGVLAVLVIAFWNSEPSNIVEVQQ